MVSMDKKNNGMEKMGEIDGQRTERNKWTKQMDKKE